MRIFSRIQFKIKLVITWYARFILTNSSKNSEGNPNDKIFLEFDKIVAKNSVIFYYTNWIEKNNKIHNEITSRNRIVA